MGTPTATAWTWCCAACTRRRGPPVEATAAPAASASPSSNPTPSWRTRVPVSDMSVFSGGQRLTAAIALYWTMARLRATERGRPRNGNSGVLLLDNPLGAANAEYLLHIQLGVAQAHGVQLVYTTGINDLNALSKFGRVLPLRNDADLRQGLRFVPPGAGAARHAARWPHLDDDRGYLSSAVLVAPTAAASGVGTVDVSALLEAQVAGSEGTASANGATGRASDES
jgi:hypothetical protein